VSVRFVLVRPKESGNVGAAARAIKNFAFAELAWVAPRCQLDAKAKARASHAGDVLDNIQTFDTLAAAVADCQLALATTARSRVAEDIVYTPRQAATTFAQPFAGEQRVALVFGPEDFGLSNDDLMHCQASITIPTGEYASLNLAQAVQVLAYEWYVTGLLEPDSDTVSGTADAGAADIVPAVARAEYEAMYVQLGDVLHLIGYTDAQREKSALTLFRNVFDSATMTERDVAAVRGLWRQVAWAARQNPDNLPKDSRE
jgi:tRNA/rRNA methyltransferase